MVSNVKLIIKAANQKYEDFIVENFDLDTTIRNLKTHLTVNYPSNPDTDSIRLIYSGKLLHDHWTLKECIRHVCKMRFVDSYYCILHILQIKKKNFLLLLTQRTPIRLTSYISFIRLLKLKKKRTILI